MRLDEPRIRPLELEELDAETRERFGSGPVLNIFRTLAHHPKLFKRWLVFGSHLLAKSTLPPREREIAILRVGWKCRAEYEWGQHVRSEDQPALEELRVMGERAEYVEHGAAAEALARLGVELFQLQGSDAGLVESHGGLLGPPSYQCSPGFVAAEGAFVDHPAARDPL